MPTEERADRRLDRLVGHSPVRSHLRYVVPFFSPCYHPPLYSLAFRGRWSFFFFPSRFTFLGWLGAKSSVDVSSFRFRVIAAVLDSPSAAPYTALFFYYYSILLAFFFSF